MKQQSQTTILGLAFGAFALSASPTMAATNYSGKLIGHGCAHQGAVCPTDRLDPHLALEPDFVLQKGSEDYYFLSNVPRDVKVRHALRTVEVSGDLDDKYRTIKVDSMRVDGKTVWSLEEQQKEWDHLHNDGWWFYHR